MKRAKEGKEACALSGTSSGGGGGGEEEMKSPEKARGMFNRGRKPRRRGSRPAFVLQRGRGSNRQPGVGNWWHHHFWFKTGNSSKYRNETIKCNICIF